MSEGPRSLPRHKDSPLRSLLITPSASPPVFRPQEPFRHDTAPPAKRPRFASTSSSSSHSARASSNVVESDIHEERRASSLRLLNLWAQLEERYSRPLDEDDIIDLSTVSLVKDRGVLRSLDKVYEMGCFAQDDHESDANGSDIGALTEGDDDLDEINFLAQADLSDELDKKREKFNVPPVRVLDPADAEDLKEFLEAERTRKELYGDEPGEEEEDVEEDQDAGAFEDDFTRDYDAPGGSRYRDKTRDSQSTTDWPEGYEIDSPLPADQEAPDGASSPPQRDAGFPAKKKILYDYESESEDEFAAWQIDEMPIAPRSVRQASPEDIIDLTDPSLSPPRTKAKAKFDSERRELSRERSSVSTSPRPTSPPRPVSPAALTIRKKKPRTFVLPPSPPNSVVQLVTPPQSSSSVVEDIQDPAGRPSPTYTDVIPPSPSPSRRTPQSEDASVADYDSPGLRRESMSPLMIHHDRPETSYTPKHNALKTPRPRLVPEVVIGAVPPRSRSTKRASASGHSSLRQSKGSLMEDALEDDPGHSQSEDSRPAKTRFPEQHAAGKDERRSTTKTSQKSSRVLSDSESRLEIPKTTPPKVRKRKRLPSPPSSLSDRYSPPRPIVTRIGPPKRGGRRHSAASTVRESENPVDESDDASLSRGDPDGKNPWAFTPSMTPSDASSSTFPHTPSFTPGSDPSGYNPKFPDSQTQFHTIAQAWQHLSYLMSAAGFPSAPVAPPPTFPLPYHMPAQPWPPATPIHQRHRLSQRQSFEVSSPGAGPSSASSTTYVEATPPHPYSTFDPAFSSGTLPPSSPFNYSEQSSPVHSSERTRSKSRSRQVRFDKEERTSFSSLAGSGGGSEGISSPIEKRRDVSLGKQHSMRRRSDIRDEEGSRIPSTPESFQSSRVERGRTPGPPSLHGRNGGADVPEKNGRATSTRKGKERG